jgi:hypothetical protein
MSALIGTIIRTLITLFAGMGISDVVGKVAADKIPQYEPPFSEGVAPWKAGFKPVKLVLLIVALIVGGIIVKFIATKFKIRILK